MKVLSPEPVINSDNKSQQQVYISHLQRQEVLKYKQLRFIPILLSDEFFHMIIGW